MYISFVRLGAIALSFVCLCAPASANVAMNFTTGFTSAGNPAPNTVHGWQFNVTTTINVTHLGLWDMTLDGFSQDYPIGMYRLSDGQLLTSGTMNTGTGDMVDTWFRYIDTPDVVLSPGEDYVVAYFAQNVGFDPLVYVTPNETFSPEINFVTSRWNDNAGWLFLPGIIVADDRIGPNFMYEVVSVPGPGALALFGLAGVVRRRRRR